MEKVLELQNEINILLQDYRDKKAEIAEKERFVMSRKSPLSSSANADKEKIKTQLNALLKEMQATWYKVKEQCRKANLSFNVDEFKSENLKVNLEDPLSTINSMLERFEKEMQGLQSAYDVTPMTALNANGLIYLIQRYLSNSSELDSAYWGGGRSDPESMRVLDEIRDIENILADIVDQIFVAYAELKELVDSMNAEIPEISDPVYHKVDEYVKPIKLVLGSYLGELKRISFNIESLPLELEDLVIYGHIPYEVTLGERTDVNEAMMFVVDKEEIRDEFEAFILERIKECYPEDSLDIINDTYDLNLGEVMNILNYNVIHKDAPTNLPILLLSTIDELDKELLIGQAYIILVCSRDEAYKHKENVTYLFDVTKEGDKFKITDSDKNEIHTM